MAFVSLRKPHLLTITSSITFLVGFAALTVFVPGGELFGSFMVIPLSLIAWGWGSRVGIIAALAVTIYTEAIFSPVYFVMRHHAVTPYWCLIVVAPVVFIFLGIVVGRLGDTLRELNAALEARKAAELALAESHAHLQAVLNALPDLMMELDREGRLHDCRSSRPNQLLSLHSASPLGRTVGELLPPDAAAAIRDALSKAAENGEYRGPAQRFVTEGRARWLELSIAAVGDPRDPGCHFIALERDVTERKNLEEQVVQSQKMEAVGRLAGGIAHDFNNILMVILGFCDLIKGCPGDQEEVRTDIGVIKDSAEKAASLTRQLLAFSRKQMIQARTADLTVLLRQSEELLRRVLGEHIILSVETGTGPSLVKVDAGQLQQVILNLAVNARDAMPGGGRLSIECHNTVLGPETASIPAGMAPGGYAAITVRDTGEGMGKETLGRIFEPFFTTKDVGKGTGLGLSIVYGIVRQLDGFITVDSRPGGGTSFRVYLPLTGDTLADPRPGDLRAPVGTETVLLVEDDEAVRRLISRSLRGWGYGVVEARDGMEAVRACRERAGSIDLLLTDIVMPGMRGEQVAREVRALLPQVHVLQMTGYTDRLDEPSAGPAVAQEETRILRKPFDLADLRTLIREALDKPHV